MPNIYHILQLQGVRQKNKGKHILIIYNENMLQVFKMYTFMNNEKILEKLAYPRKICYTVI